MNFGKVELLTLCDGHGEVDLVDPVPGTMGYPVMTHLAMAVVLELGIQWQTVLKVPTYDSAGFWGFHGLPNIEIPMDLFARWAMTLPKSVARRSHFFDVFFRPDRGPIRENSIIVCLIEYYIQ